MKKILKILFVLFISISALLYAAFLFVLPKAVDLSIYKAELQKIVKDNAKLILDYDNAQVITSPFLAAGIKADNITITLPDGSLLFSASNIKAAVSLPQLLLKNIKLSKAQIDNPFINAEIMPSGEDYKIVKLIEDIINENKAASFAQKIEKEESSKFNFDNIKIIIPNLKLNNYRLLITDKQQGHYLDLYGKKLNFGWFNAERMRIKTIAELCSDKNKNADFNIDINTFLPAASHKLDREDDPAEKVDFNFINPVSVYRNYDPKASVNAAIRINQTQDGKIKSFGYFNIENLTMKISSVKLPENHFRLKTFGYSADIDFDINTHENENLKLSGHINYGSSPAADIKFNAQQIKFENLPALLKASLDSMQIKNELQQYKAQGSLTADFALKTNFKKMRSSGFINIKNGGLSVHNPSNKNGAADILSKMNLNINFDNNALNIKNSTFYLGGAPVSISGIIDDKSYTDIKVSADNVPLPVLFNNAAPKKLRSEYDLKSGSLSSVLKIQGKMKEAVYYLNNQLKNIDFRNSSNSIAAANKLSIANLVYNVKNKKLNAEVKNYDFRLLFPKTNSSIRLPEISAEILNGNILLNQNIIYFNDKSAFMYQGGIENYLNPEDINFTLSGGINAGDLIKFIGNKTKPFFNAKGNIPVNMSFTGNKLRQTFSLQAKGSKDGFITPVNFDALQNKDTLLQAKAVFKPGRIKIKDTGFYTIASAIGEDGSGKIVYDAQAGIDGTIEGDTINLLKISIPKNLTGNIAVFPKSSFELEKNIIYLYGKSAAPLIKGRWKIKNIMLPELSAALNEAGADFKGGRLDFYVNKIMLPHSDVNITGILNPIISNRLNIYDFDISSNNFKAEDAALLSSKAAAYAPAAEKGSKKTGGEKQSSSNMPILVHSGSMDMKKITSGKIEIYNTKSDIALLKNILALKNLSSDIFKGRTSGNIFIDLGSMLVKTDLKGTGINAEKALYDSAGLKDSLSGAVSYSAKLFIDAAADTPEKQMKAISGSIDVKIKNGQFGPFGRLENLILAENIRESQFFQTALGGVINSLATIDTTHFDELNAHISLKDGICILDPVTSKGNVMNLHIFGRYDILKNYADMKARVKLTSVISNLLGPINAVNPVNLINSAASLNVVTAKAFSIFCETASEEEMNIMPNFDNKYVDLSASKFQLGIRGDAAKPLTLVKSFKWLASPMQFKKAEEFISKLPEPIEGAENASIEETIKMHQEQEQALEAEKKTLKYKIKHLFKKNNEENI